MPHPEDLVDPLMGGTDGKPLFDALAAALAAMNADASTRRWPASSG